MPKLHVLTKDDAGKEIIVRKAHIHKVYRPVGGVTTIVYTDRNKPRQRISGTVADFFKLLLLLLTLAFSCSAGISPAVAEEEEKRVWETETSTTIVVKEKIIICDTTETGLVICQEL